VSDPIHERGLRVRREVLGEEHVARALSEATPLTAPFQEHITSCAWGSVWAREQLDRRTRSAITLALLCALGHERELAMHARAALRNGLSEEEIGEVLLHTSVYAGVPAANRGYAVVAAALQEDGS
jgi:4-carboxymuconolactone decarboxylase